MIEHARVDLLDASSRLVHFTQPDDPQWSGVMVLAPGEREQLAGDVRHDLFVLGGTLEAGLGRELEGGDFAVRNRAFAGVAGPAGAMLLAYRDACGARCDEMLVLRDERPWRAGRAPGMLLASLRPE